MILELFPGEKGNAAHCDRMCEGCAYASADLSKKLELRYQDHVATTYKKTEKFFETQGVSVHTKLCGVPSQIDPASVPSIGPAAMMLSLTAGPIDAYDSVCAEQLMEYVKTISSSSIEPREYGLPVDLAFTDNALNLFDPESDVSDQIKSIFDGWRNIVSGSLHPLINQSFVIDFSANRVGNEEYRRIATAEEVVKSVYKELEHEFRTEWGPEQGPAEWDFKREGHWFEFYGGLYPEETPNLVFSGRYLFAINPDGKNQTWTEKITGLTFYPTKVLLNHSTQSINVPWHWMGYDEFHKILDSASDSEDLEAKLVNHMWCKKKRQIL